MAWNIDSQERLHYRRNRPSTRQKFDRINEEINLNPRFLIPQRTGKGWREEGGKRARLPRMQLMRSLSFLLVTYYDIPRLFVAQIVPDVSLPCSPSPSPPFPAPPSPSSRSNDKGD